MPAIEITGVDVEDDRDETPDVGDGDRLGMQVQEGRNLLKEHGGVEVGWHSEGAQTGARGLWWDDGECGSCPLLGGAATGDVQGLGGGRVGLGGARHRGVVGGLALRGEALRLGCGDVLVRVQLQDVGEDGAVALAGW